MILTLHCWKNYLKMIIVLMINNITILASKYDLIKLKSLLIISIDFFSRTF